LVQKRLLKALKQDFEQLKKIIIIGLKNVTLTLHAEKALNKKLWYLRNQGAVVTTNPADHQTGLQSRMTGQKEHPHQEEILQKAATAPIAANHPAKITANALPKKDLFRLQEINRIKAGKAMAINRQAVSAVVKKNPLP
jgi:hypothetical protein